MGTAYSRPICQLEKDGVVYKTNPLASRRAAVFFGWKSGKVDFRIPGSIPPTTYSMNNHYG